MKKGGNFRNTLLLLSLFLFLAGTTSIPSPAMAQTGIVAYYPFNGNANDESGNGNNGTVGGEPFQPSPPIPSPYYTEPLLTEDRFGVPNSAYIFDGNNDFIHVPDSSSLDITGGITLAAWIYPTEQKTQHIVRKGPENYTPYELALSETGAIIFGLNFNGSSPQARKEGGYALSQWTFVAGTYDGTSMKLYVDGVLASTEPATGSITQNDSKLLIGTRLNLPADTFKGKLDEIRIYNSALTSDEILQRYISDTYGLIDRTVWADLEVIRWINNGVLESELRRYGANGSNYLHFYDPDTINSFQADVTVKDYENNGSYPHASLLGYVYNHLYDDGTPGDGATGDVVGVVGIGHNGTQLEGFWSISRCTAPNCNLPTELVQICTGLVDPLFSPSLKNTYPISFSWDGSAFTFGIGVYSKVINSSSCGVDLPTNRGLPKVKAKGIGTRVTNITTGSGEGGFVSATFDNVYVNGSLYDNFDSSNMINLTNWWGTLELVRMVDNGELVSELTQRGVNGTNNMSFVDSQHILGFEADLKVVEVQYNADLPVRPLARLYAALYNDGTGNSTPGDLTGDINVAVGISGQGTDPQAFYAVTRCLANNCNLQDEYEFLFQGIFPVTVAINEIHRFSISWDGSNVALGCDGNIISYNPTSQATVAGPPKGRKGIGTRVNEISNASEWAYVSAAFDNVLVLSTGYPLTVTKSGSGSGTVTSSDLGINCGSDCGEGYSSGTPVTLTAIPAGGSFFAGWSGGGCSGTGTCTVTMNSYTSVTATFEIVAPPLPPPPPVLYLPSAGETGISLTPTLSWYDSAGATSYRVQVSKFDSFSGLDVDQSGITGTLYPVPSGLLLNNTTYYWHVNATNVGGTSDWSQVRSFHTIVTSLSAPTLLSPADGATGVPITLTLSWDTSTGATYYGLQVATDLGFSSIVVNQVGITDTDTSYPVPTGKLVNGITYYWRVYAADIDLGASDWSEIRHFTTVSAPAGPPAPPTLLSPNNGQTQVPTNPTLTWNASTGATSYRLQVSTDPAFGTTVYDNSGTTTSRLVSGLANSETYYWHVNATGGTSDWSAIWSFITEAQFGVPFKGAGGMLDPDLEPDGPDGIDDTFESTKIFTSPLKKTLFIRPKLEITAPAPGQEGQYEYWADFKNTYFPSPSPGRVDIPPFSHANIEVVVIGDPTNPYEPMGHFDYSPATDSNFTANPVYGCDILEIIFKQSGAFSSTANGNYGHTFFDPSKPTWTWDTKGYTPLGAPYGYGTPEIYPFAHENYFNEGTYPSIVLNQVPTTIPGGPPTCKTGQCYDFTKQSPMNWSGVVPPGGMPDTTVEINTVSFDKTTKKITSVGAKGKEFNRLQVYTRTIAHELGHALGMAHCNNPACVMYGNSTDWDMKDFGTGGNCTHNPRALIHNGPATPRAPFLRSPLNNAQVTKPVTLYWNSSKGATSYQLQVSTANTSNFSTTLVNVTLSGSTTSYTVTNIPATTSLRSYYWRVRGGNLINGVLTWGPWQPSTPTPQFFRTK